MSNYSGIEQILQELEAAIHNTYHFTDKAIPWEALQSPGSLHVVIGEGLNGRPLTKDANKPMALIGDAVLRQIVVTEMVTAGRSKGEDRSELYFNDLRHAKVKFRMKSAGFSTILC